MSVYKLPNGRWQARYTDSYGTRRGRVFTLKKDAERFERDSVTAVERGTDIAPKGLTIEDLIETWWPTVKLSVKPRSVNRYRDHVRVIERHPISRLPLNRVNYAAVQGFVEDLSAHPYAPKTVGAIYGVLNLILIDAAKRGRILAPPPKPVMPKVMKRKVIIPTRAEVEQLAEASTADLHTAILLGGYAGMRQGEILALQRGDVDLAKRTAFIHQARNKDSGEFESTKTEKSRMIHLPQVVCESLAVHFDEYPSETLFPVSASVFDKSWNHARRSLGLTLWFHDLRHACASMCIAAGWSVIEVTNQLGHSTPTETLNTYAHLWPNSMGEAMTKFDSYLAAA